MIYDEQVAMVATPTRRIIVKPKCVQTFCNWDAKIVEIPAIEKSVPVPLSLIFLRFILRKNCRITVSEIV